MQVNYNEYQMILPWIFFLAFIWAVIYFLDKKNNYKLYLLALAFIVICNWNSIQESLNSFWWWMKPLLMINFGNKNQPEKNSQGFNPMGGFGGAGGEENDRKETGNQNPVDSSRGGDEEGCIKVDYVFYKIIRDAVKNLNISKEEEKEILKYLHAEDQDIKQRVYQLSLDTSILLDPERSKQIRKIIKGYMADPVMGYAIREACERHMQYGFDASEVASDLFDFNMAAVPVTRRLFQKQDSPDWD